MQEEYLRDRVRHFLKKEASVRSGGDINQNSGLLIGGDINQNTGLLIGGARRVGRPRKVGRPKQKKTVSGAGRNTNALADWRAYFMQYRTVHPNMPYREAQKKAAIAYKQL